MTPIEEPSSSQPPSDALVVVICDDHPAFARGLALLLPVEDPGLVVGAVTTSAAEAEAAVADEMPDVVLMDVRMPGTNGIEATRRIRSLSSTTRVVMLTASEEQSDLFEAIRAGATGYVVKDRDLAEIAAAVRSVCRGQLVIPAHLAGRFIAELSDLEPSLSEIERTLLAGIAAGATNRDLAESLHMSERTIRRRIEDLYARLHLSDRIQAAVYAAERGIGGGR